MIGIVPVARVVQFLFGERYKGFFYKYAKYFGHYRNHYACYGFIYFLQNIGKARGEIAFSVEAWFRENGIPLPMRSD